MICDVSVLRRHGKRLKKAVIFNGVSLTLESRALKPVDTPAEDAIMFIGNLVSGAIRHVTAVMIYADGIMIRGLEDPCCDTSRMYYQEWYCRPVINPARIPT